MKRVNRKLVFSFAKEKNLLAFNFFFNFKANKLKSFKLKLIKISVRNVEILNYTIILCIVRRS